MPVTDPLGLIRSLAMCRFVDELHGSYVSPTGTGFADMPHRGGNPKLCTRMAGEKNRLRNARLSLPSAMVFLEDLLGLVSFQNGDRQISRYYRGDHVWSTPASAIAAQWKNTAKWPPILTAYCSTAITIREDDIFSSYIMKSAECNFYPDG